MIFICFYMFFVCIMLGSPGTQRAQRLGLALRLDFGWRGQQHDRVAVDRGIEAGLGAGERDGADAFLAQDGAGQLDRGVGLDERLHGGAGDHRGVDR